jgi:hypothetical protein
MYNGEQINGCSGSCNGTFGGAVGAVSIAKKLRDITKEDAVKSYEDLKKIAAGCSKAAQLSRAGIAALDYFFLQHRLKAKTKKHISFANAVKQRKTLRYINDKIRQINGNSAFKDRIRLLKRRYSIFQLYYGSINQFRPTEALKVYCRFKPRIGILDFSSGWGGRCLAAMAAGIPYTGIDTNTNMRSAYNNILKTYGGANTNVKMIWGPSEKVDFSKLKYDLVFTSPPYYILEEYEKMPTYKSKEDFYERFLRTVVRGCWKWLPQDGVLALNMPADMFDAVKGCLPVRASKLKLAVSNRHPTNAAAGRRIGEEVERGEFIYVWRKKTARGTDGWKCD